MKFEIDTSTNIYTEGRWLAKLRVFGFEFEKISNKSTTGWSTNWSTFRRKAPIKKEFESIHQLTAFVKNIGAKVKIVPGEGCFRITLLDENK
jgi:predicted amino acid racemase